MRWVLAWLVCAGALVAQPCEIDLGFTKMKWPIRADAAIAQLSLHDWDSYDLWDNCNTARGGFSRRYSGNGIDVIISWNAGYDTLTDMFVEYPDAMFRKLRRDMSKIWSKSKSPLQDHIESRRSSCNLVATYSGSTKDFLPFVFYGCIVCKSDSIVRYPVRIGTIGLSWPVTEFDLRWALNTRGYEVTRTNFIDGVKYCKLWGANNIVSYKSVKDTVTEISVMSKDGTEDLDEMYSRHVGRLATQKSVGRTRVYEFDTHNFRARFDSTLNSLVYQSMSDAKD